MNTVPFQIRRGAALAVFVAATALANVMAAPQTQFPALLDDFSDAQRSSVGHARFVIDDSSVGGQSRLSQSFADGALLVEGEIAPARGQPGWVSIVLPLAGSAEPADLGAYEGVRLKVRVRKGILSVSANSARIENFDYHAALVQGSAERIQEITIPFAAMKRAWSEQIPLDPTTINSVSLIAFGAQKGAFAYEIDEIGFY